MELNEYIKMKKKTLNNFKEKWVKENKNNPSLWPMEMNEGDWEEQVDFYDESD